MKIAVCDDNSDDLVQLSASLDRYAGQERLDVTLLSYSEPDKFLHELDASGVPDVSFLDIYMKGHSGVELARAIREKDRRAVIVFVTSSPEHMAEGYSVGAVHYLLKPWSEDDIAAAMERALQITGASVRHLSVMSNRQMEHISISDIVYIESRDKLCHIFTASGREIITRMQLAALSGELDDSRFLWCHRSFIVNMDHIKAVNKNDFILWDDKLVPIRSHGKGDVLREYKEYRFGRIREEL